MDNFFYSKTVYMELLAKNRTDGLIANEIIENYLDVNYYAAIMALRRLQINGDARRTKIGRSHRYWISQRGLSKLEYMLGKEE